MLLKSVPQESKNIFLLLFLIIFINFTSKIGVVLKEFSFTNCTISNPFNFLILKNVLIPISISLRLTLNILSIIFAINLKIGISKNVDFIKISTGYLLNPSPVPNKVTVCPFNCRPSFREL